MPASSAMRASRRLSGHEPDQRSGTSVTARPDEQFGPNKPIFSALALYMLMRSRMDAWGASNGRPSVGRGRRDSSRPDDGRQWTGWTGSAPDAKYRRMSGLVSPIRLGPYELRNRVVMAPMTRNRAGPGETPTALMATYYAQRASAGLIVTEGTQISPQGQGYPGTPGIFSQEQVEGWSQVTAAVH